MTGPNRWQLAMLRAFAAFWILAACVSAFAQGTATPSLLDSFLAKTTPTDVFPGADRFGSVQGSPPVAPVFQGQQRVGFVYLASDYVDSRGYSGKPIHVLVALDNAGTVVGLRIAEHSEPILMVGVPEERIIESLNSYVGFNPLRARAAGGGPPRADIVSGATVTVLIIGDSVVRSSSRVARMLQLGGPGPAAAGAAGAAGTAGSAAAPAGAAGAPGAAGAAGAAQSGRVVDPEAGNVTSWETLREQGAVAHLRVTVGEVNQAFVDSGDAIAARLTQTGAPDDVFIDLYITLISQPAIARSLLDPNEYADLQRMLAPGQHALLIAARGPYSFKGAAWFRGGIFDRLELVQGIETIRFWKRHHLRIGRIVASDAPNLREIGAFAIPEGAEFDPTAPWELRLIAQRPVGKFDHAFVTFTLPYRLPELYTMVAPLSSSVAAVTGSQLTIDSSATESAAAFDEADAVPLWMTIWKSRVAAIVVLGLMLAALTIIFFFQDLLVPREKLFDRVRLVFLAVTLLWLGWVAQAQLSVVNVLTFASSLRTDFRWESFLVDPLIFILWCSVAAALLFWGRGPFCGWLCPFGALQELTNRVARALKVPQLKVPWGVHQRLLPTKYIIFLGLFGVSLGSLVWAERLAEIEPFKTAIVLRFLREWWFVAFALALLAAGLFIERFFCRYLCPLGAALAIPGRLRIFDWLPRYRECGNPCMRCFNECPVGAIHPEGQISPNECIGCLHCQVLYHHDHKCPVRIQRRVKREKREAMAGTPAPAAAGVPVTVHRRRSMTLR